MSDGLGETGDGAGPPLGEVPRCDPERWRDRSVVVTGATGFIGAALSEALLRAGARVLGIDRDWSDACAIRRERLDRLRRFAGFAPCEVDLRDPVRLCEALAPRAGSVVFHLAARPGVREPDVAATWADNVNGTDNLLRALARTRPAQIVFASSSSVYGPASPLPATVAGLTGTPPSHYSRSKLIGEVALRRFHAQTSVPVTVARPFNVYGPRGRADTAPLAFARRLVAGEPIALAAAGTVERDFTYVHDAIDALILLAEAADRRGGFATVNVGTGVRTSIRTLLTLLGERLGVVPTVLEAPAHPLDAPATQADTTALVERVGWRPATSLEAGIDELARWLRGAAPGAASGALAADD